MSDDRAVQFIIDYSMALFWTFLVFGMVFFFAPIVSSYQYDGHLYAIWSEITSFGIVSKMAFLIIGFSGGTVMWITAKWYPRPTGEDFRLPESVDELRRTSNLDMNNYERNAFRVYLFLGLPIWYITIFLSCGLLASLFT